MDSKFKPWVFDYEVAKLAVKPAWLVTCSKDLGTKFVAIQKAMADKRVVYRTAPDVCSINTVDDMQSTVEELRPITAAKVADPAWQAKVEQLAKDVKHLRPQEPDDVEKGRKDKRAASKVPNSMPDGLPGFKYPAKILPPIMKIEAPSGKPLPKGPDDHRKDTTMGFNFNAPSKVFGPVQSIGERISVSPLKPKNGWKCGDLNRLHIPGFNIPSFPMSFDVHMPTLPSLNLPNLLAGAALSLPPCVAQFIPTMFMPKNQLASVSLGGGAEIALVQNGAVKANNFGTAFKVNAGEVGSLVNTAAAAAAGLPSAAMGALGNVVGQVNSAASTLAQKAVEATGLGAAASAAKGLLAQGSTMASSALANNPFTQAIAQATSAAASLAAPAIQLAKLPLSSVGLTFGANPQGGLSLGFKSNTLSSVANLGGAVAGALKMPSVSLPAVSGLQFKVAGASVSLPNLKTPNLDLKTSLSATGIAVPKIPNIVPAIPTVSSSIPASVLDKTPTLPQGGTIKPALPSGNPLPELPKLAAVPNNVLSSAQAAITSGVATVQSMKMPTITTKMPKMALW